MENKELNELKKWLLDVKSELEKIKLPVVSVHYGLIKGSVLMIDMILEKIS